MPITGTWQFRTGDDLAWANPAYDDSGWQAIRADKPWGAQGHRGYSGFAWYRKRIEIGESGQPIGIFLNRTKGAYEVYWNGTKVGSSGSLPPHALWYIYGRRAVFPLRDGSARSGVLAFRFWEAPLATADDPADGGMRVPPFIGRMSVLQERLQFFAYRLIVSNLPATIAASLILAAMLLCLLLFFRRPHQWLYLWLGMLLFGNGIALLSPFSDYLLSFAPLQITLQLHSDSTSIGLWLILLTVFGLNRSRRWRVGTWIVIAVYIAAETIDTAMLLFWQHAGKGMIQTDAVTTQIYTYLDLYALMLIGFGLARRRTWSLVPLGVVALLCGAYNPIYEFIDLFDPAAANRIVASSALTFGDYRFSDLTLLNWLLIITLGITVALMQLREGRRQAKLEEEIRSAQEVQQVLIPEEIPPIPGLAIRSVYKPAAEVGGDFFQVIPPAPDDPDSGTVIVVGDVSGKGLRAAMTVSLIVGTIRTLAEQTQSPAAMLAGLNRRLMGRTQGGFATCLVLRIDSEGNGLLANGGHLAPYLDGEEWDVPPSLPLGLSLDAEYDEVRVHLKEAETLTFITDGVLEARDQKGELYGFERVASLMRGRPSAEDIAEAACSFGQDDDITVVSVTRSSVAKPVVVTSWQPAVLAS